MKILLVSATLLEIEGYLKTLENTICLGKNFLRGFEENRLIDVIVTGVGAAATTGSLSTQLNNSRYDLIINTGICGSYNKNYSPGKVVNISTEIWGDLGVEDQDEFLDLFDLEISKPGEKPFTGKKLINEGSVFSSFFTHLPQVNGITVNTAHGNKNSIEKCVQKFNPDVESMESAAIFSICKTRGINFQCLRSISNFVEPRNRQDWEMEKALYALVKELKQILSVIRK